MSRTLHTQAGRILIAAAMLALGSHDAVAQTNHARRVVLALADSLPVANAEGALLFRAPPTGQHVILLRARNARPELVGGALSLLRRLEEAHASDQHSAVVPLASAIPGKSITAGRMQSLRSLIRQASARPLSRLGDAGQGRWIEIDPLPPRRQ